MRWTLENTETLKALWSEGLSASQIAERIGGVTRNAVIGKIHRIGLGGRRKGPRVPRRTLPRAKASPPPSKPQRVTGQLSRIAGLGQPTVSDLPPLGAAPSTPVTVLTLARGLCHWPEGDPKLPDFHFCGRPAKDRFCPHHARRAYQPREAEADGAENPSSPPRQARPSRRALFV